MDSNKIKNLAAGVREALRAEAGARLDSVLAEGSRARLEHRQQVARLEERLRAEGREAVVDSAAYTWFNRLCALRYMDAHGYTSTPVVTPRPGSTQPAVLADAMQGVFDPEYPVTPELRSDLATMTAEQVYEGLLAAVCERYAAPMPYLFSDDVASSLLMPQGLLAQDSILSRIVSELDDEACESVEVLGWLYQFYIAERKDEVFASYKKGKKARAEDIAPATQLFTPEWIVRYLTENSLGRLWMLSNPNSALADSMEYYIAPEGEEKHLAISSADEIRVFDPACGSGHILVYAFDLLYRMYEEEGYLPEDIPAKILQNNLSGLEIDRRAAEIASFALEMKALERDPRFLEGRIDADIRVLEPVKLTTDELQTVPGLAEHTALLEAMAHMDEVGSLYVPDAADALAIKSAIEHVEHSGTLMASALLGKLRTMLANVEALARTFHVVVANPPYMGSGNMNPWMSAWVKENYPDYKGDLFAAFVKRNTLFAKDKGELGFMTPYVWMFISSYEKLRRMLIEDKTITSLIQLEYSGFAEATVPICTFTVSNQHLDGYKGGYVRLADFVGAQAQAPRALEAIHNPDCGWFYRADADDFKAIPGWPIAYWTAPEIREMYQGPLIGSRYVGKEGVGTRKDSVFLRLFWEVSQAKTGAHKRWLLTDKAGGYRKWHLGQTYVMDWENDGFRIKNYRNPDGSLRSRPQNLEYLYKPGVSWGKVGSGDPSFRVRGEGFGFNDAAPTLFGPDLIGIAGFLNSSMVRELLRIQGETLNLTTGVITGLPLPSVDNQSDDIHELVSSNILLSRSDWDSFETSWDFEWHPLVPSHNEWVDQHTYNMAAEARRASVERIEARFERWEDECQRRFDKLKSNEEELNRIFARICGMEGEVPIEVPDDKVSVRLADRARDARSLVSYGVGCMLGRYSTYEPGLILADQGQTQADFREKVSHAGFLCDEDNVLPVLDEEWFADDIVTGFRAWLADAFGADTLEENVSWLEESLGKDLRSYFCRDFYADHVRVYQKRPIYWMFSSPRGAFRCLIYMHRYRPGTVGTILSGYLREYEGKLRTRIQLLSSEGAGARDAREADKLRAALAECEQWERDVVYPLAHERIEIDLDDGVKVNYNKFPHALAKVAGLSDWK